MVDRALRHGSQRGAYEQHWIACASLSLSLCPFATTDVRNRNKSHSAIAATWMVDEAGLSIEDVPTIIAALDSGCFELCLVACRRAQSPCCATHSGDPRIPAPPPRRRGLGAVNKQWKAAQRRRETRRRQQPAAAVMRSGRTCGVLGDLVIISAASAAGRGGRRALFLNLFTPHATCSTARVLAQFGSAFAPSALCPANLDISVEPSFTSCNQ
jgi:hypothetical protein